VAASAVPAIVVPVYGRLDLAAQCLRAIDEHSYVSVPVLVIDDCGPQQMTPDLVRGSLRSGRRFTLVRHERNAGFVASVNDAFVRCAGSDVVLVNSDVTVLPGWLAGLREALDDSPDTATASAVADRGGILSVAELDELRGETADVVRQRVECARRGTATAAEIPVAVGHCTYFARQALADVGGFDVAFSPGYGEDVDWSLRARRAGWRHVVALHSYVWHDEGASFGLNPARNRLRLRHEARILARYPRSFLRMRRSARDTSSPLAIELGALSRALAADTGREIRLTRVR
jgi:GT2 family glycosyltransferase